MFLTSISNSQGCSQKPLPECSSNQADTNTYTKHPNKKHTTHQKNIRENDKPIIQYKTNIQIREGRERGEYLHRIEEGFFYGVGGSGGFQGHPWDHAESSGVVLFGSESLKHQKLNSSTFCCSSWCWEWRSFFYVCPRSHQNMLLLQYIKHNSQIENYINNRYLGSC